MTEKEVTEYQIKYCCPEMIGLIERQDVYSFEKDVITLAIAGLHNINYCPICGDKLESSLCS